MRKFFSMGKNHIYTKFNLIKFILSLIFNILLFLFIYSCFFVGIIVYSVQLQLVHRKKEKTFFLHKKTTLPLNNAFHFPSLIKYKASNN